MTSTRSSQNGQGISDPDVIKAARKYVRGYRDHAVNYLVSNCDPVSLLHEACLYKGHKFYTVMSQDSDSEDDTESQSSRCRTLSSNSRSELASSSSAILSSSASGDGSSPVLWVVAPKAGLTAPMTLTARHLPESDYLIQAEVVHNHLKLKPKHLSVSCRVRYNGGPIMSDSTISLEWAWSPKGLKSEKVQRSTFYVVEELPDSQVVLSGSDPQDSPTNHDGDLSFGRNARPSSHGYSPVADMPPTGNKHGFHLQQPPYTHSVTENSTTTTAKQTFSRASQGLRARRQSTASDNSKIPVRQTSGNSVRSGSSGQPRAPGGRPLHDMPIMPPPFAQSGPTSGFKVAILYRKSLMPFKLDLNVSGPIFYELLNQVIKQNMRCELNRECDQVRFTPNKDVFDNCCWVSLVEDEVEYSWEIAVDWLSQFKGNAPPKVYAVVGPNDGPDDD